MLCSAPGVDAGAPQQGDIGLDTDSRGFGTAAQASVILAVFAIVLVGMVVLAQRQAAVEAYVAEASARATPDSTPAPTEDSPSGIPARDAAGPGTYTVQYGESLFEIAARVGVTPDELIFWNADDYPSLDSTPAIQPGWVLSTSGPPLPTPRPIGPPPTETQPPTQVAGLPTFSAASFPASERVTLDFYPVTGSSRAQIFASMDEGGPYSEWVGGNADAAVEVDTSFNFELRQSGGACTVTGLREPLVDFTYRVTIPAWQPDPGVPPALVVWWTDLIEGTVAHEAQHITLWESYLPELNEAVRGATCDSVEADVLRVLNAARRANCEYDFAEYGASLGLSLEECVEG